MCNFMEPYGAIIVVEEACQQNILNKVAYIQMLWLYVPRIHVFGRIANMIWNNKYSVDGVNLFFAIVKGPDSDV